MTNPRPLSNYPGGFANGVSIQGVPIVNTQSGNVWWVSSTTGKDGNKGTFAAPFATLARAFAFAATGDIVFLKANHAESVTSAAAIDLSVAGVQVVGLGTGLEKPTFTFTTATTATMRMSADGVWIMGCRFINGIASLATMWTFTGKNCVVANNEFWEGSATTGLSFIDLVGITANAADGLKILNNYFYNPTAGNYNHAVGLTTVHDNVEVAGNYIIGNFALSGIHNITGKVLTNINVHDNYVRNLTAAKPALNFISAVTGQAYDNRFVAGDTTVNDAIFGTALNQTGLNIGSKGNLGAGQEFWLVKKGVVSSTVTQAGVDISVASVGGEIGVLDVIVKTGATGLAGGTNFQVTTNNSNGLAVIFAETVANLGANKTMDLSGASVTKIRSVIELGKKVTLKSTAADCTGAGTIDVYLRCVRLTAGADISNA